MAKIYSSLVLAVLVALLKCSNPVKASPLDGDDGAVLYDSSIPVEPLEMPASCKGQTYCFEKGANYPQENIEKLLAGMRLLKADPEPLTNTDSCDGDDEYDCLSNSTESPIFYIIDNNDKVRVVVQSPKKFTQIHSVKWCRDEGRIKRDTPHFLKNSNVLQKFKIECVSSKMDLDFIVLSEEVNPDTQEHEMQIASASIPVCCRCRYQDDYS